MERENHPCRIKQLCVWNVENLGIRGGRRSRTHSIVISSHRSQNTLIKMVNNEKSLQKSNMSFPQALWITFLHDFRRISTIKRVEMWKSPPLTCEDAEE